MALTDTFVKQVKPTGSPAGDKYSDGGGMYLLVKSSGKYWRMDYRFAEKRKTFAIGVYPAVSLAKARKRRESARELLADGVDPSDAKREQKETLVAELVNTFKAVALEWHRRKSKGCAQNTSKKTPHLNGEPHIPLDWGTPHRRNQTPRHFEDVEKSRGCWGRLHGRTLERNIRAGLSVRYPNW